MIQFFIKTNVITPNEFHNSFFDIDFKKLYEEGRRFIITDLDNTLISYEEKLPTKQIEDTLDSLQALGYEVCLLSNNHQERIDVFKESLMINGYASARKPLLFGAKKALQSASKAYKSDEIIFIGDQVMTDIICANRLNAFSILVNPIKRKTEKWYTKMNRIMESKMLQKLQKKEPETYHRLGLQNRS